MYVPRATSRCNGLMTDGPTHAHFARNSILGGRKIQKEINKPSINRFVVSTCFATLWLLNKNHVTGVDLAWLLDRPWPSFLTALLLYKMADILHRKMNVRRDNWWYYCEILWNTMEYTLKITDINQRWYSVSLRSAYWQYNSLIGCFIAKNQTSKNDTEFFILFS